MIISTLIGLVSAVITILIFSLYKRIDKHIIYGLILAGIGFLYIGYTWSEITTAVISGIQALVFISFAYYGIRENINSLIAGYFLHGIWDMLYPFIGNPSLLPPHYDFFCLTYDFIVGGYLLFVKYQTRVVVA